MGRGSDDPLRTRAPAGGADCGKLDARIGDLWQPFLKSRRALVVCLGTPLFVRFPGFGFFRDPKTNDWQEDREIRTGRRCAKALGDRELLPSYNFTGAGEASAAFLLGRLLATRKRTCC